MAHHRVLDHPVDLSFVYEERKTSQVTLERILMGFSIWKNTRKDTEDRDSSVGGNGEERLLPGKHAGFGQSVPDKHCLVDGCRHCVTQTFGTDPPLRREATWGFVALSQKKSGYYAAQPNLCVTWPLVFPTNRQTARDTAVKKWVLLLPVCPNSRRFPFLCHFPFPDFFWNTGKLRQ